MVRFSQEDTIAAIATSMGEGGIGIVRISGKDACFIVDRIFRPKGVSSSLLRSCGYTIHYGWIVSAGPAASTDGSGADRAGCEVIDEVLVLVMKAPRSFTREDVVEIQCHGGLLAVRRVLEQLLANGCRLAQPGEFTRRAFLNGRIDLSQAEAVLDIVRAKSESALKIGVQQLQGAVSQKINRLREAALEIVSALEAHIDFPDEISAGGQESYCRERVRNFIAAVRRLREEARLGRLYREGVSVVICGKPNTGKSSLLNALLRQERSIVTEIAGTTRDTIEECVQIKGVPVRLVDTAGILAPRNIIEKKALSRSSRSIRTADIILLVFDASLPLSVQDKKIMRRLSAQRAITIAVINKIDLKRRIDTKAITRTFLRCVEISAKKSRQLDRLEEALMGLIGTRSACAPESAIVGSLRHIQALASAEKHATGALRSLERGMSAELVAQDVKDSLSCLDEIVGKHFSEDLLEKIFNDFCIGK